MRRTRFAPSPTGPLHLGHLYAALIAAERGDEVLLRIEDIDHTRCRTHWDNALIADLEWSGFTYLPPVRQSERQAAYDAALDDLWYRGLLYPCTCTRKDIEAAACAPQEGAPLHGPDGVIYPGTCRPSHGSQANTCRPGNVALRLDMASAVMAAGVFTHRITGRDSHWQWFAGFNETGTGPEGQTGLQEFTSHFAETAIGDVVLARKDFGTSYHLSVVVDDAAQGITEVTRGQDLFEATPIHVILQRLLGLPTPDYHHHALIRDHAGKRLAKRDDARAIAAYRDAGWKPQALMDHLEHNLTPPPHCPE